MPELEIEAHLLISFLLICGILLVYGCLLILGTGFIDFIPSF